MRYYDYKKVKQLIDENAPEITEASLGMHEDWFWTAQTIFEKGEWTQQLFLGDLIAEREKYKAEMVEAGQEKAARQSVRDKYEHINIGGIAGSSWATPTLRLDYADGSCRMIPVFTGEKSSGQVFAVNGCLSGPVQQQIPELEEITAES